MFVTARFLPVAKVYCCTDLNLILVFLQQEKRKKIKQRREKKASRVFFKPSPTMKYNLVYI